MIVDMKNYTIIYSFNGKNTWVVLSAKNKNHARQKFLQNNIGNFFKVLDIN